ncbi:hypothetical protein OFM36_35030, partial [Escherichia coli]|nr:hypothetical protein [Escherichia coli]
AGRLEAEPGLCNVLKPQEFGNTLNALSKWPDTPICAAAVNALASRLANNRKLHDGRDGQDMGNALNAQSK